MQRWLSIPICMVLAVLSGAPPAARGDPPATIALVTRQDSERLLVAAARAFVAKHVKRPHDLCVMTKIGLGETHELVGPVVAGWHMTGKPDPSAMRDVPGPKIETLPVAARTAFGPEPARCVHPIHFGNPSYIEIRSPRGNYLLALVSLADLCPLCGEGYEIQFRRVGQAWRIELPGLYETWIS